MPAVKNPADRGPAAAANPNCKVVKSADYATAEECESRRVYELCIPARGGGRECGQVAGPCTALAGVGGATCEEKSRRECTPARREEGNSGKAPYETECLVCPGKSDNDESDDEDDDDGDIPEAFIRNDGGNVIATVFCKIVARASPAGPRPRAAGDDVVDM